MFETPGSDITHATVTKRSVEKNLPLDYFRKSEKPYEILMKNLVENFPDMRDNKAFMTWKNSRH